MNVRFKHIIPLCIAFVLVASGAIVIKTQAAGGEMDSAYQYGLNAGIVDSSSKAKLLGKLTRKEAAKMFVVFAKKVNPNIQIDSGVVCNLSDILNQSSDTQSYIIQACQLGIMGRNNDNSVSAKFNPNGVMTRAQVGTILSRVLYGGTYNGGSNWYVNHLQALKKNGVLTNINNPNTAELRGYVLLMMMRSESKKGPSQNPPRSGDKQNPPRSGNMQNPPKSGNVQNPPKSGNQQGGNQSGNQSSYSIAQAISDNAQLSTLAFDGLGFLAGNFCSDTFLPPGKVADFFGFQYLRDVTQEGKGHSTDFVTNAANNILSILTDTQKAKLITLAKSQADSVNQYATKRFPLMAAFRRQLNGDIPTGTSALSKDAVMSYSADLYALDAQISIDRAKLYADIFNSLSTTQKASISTMLSGGFYSWAALPDQIDKSTLTHDEDVLVMTYAGDILSRYADDVEADTYFCPERQGDYFGGFYVKDAPAVGNAGYTIAETITADKGQQFLDSLSSTQKPLITSIVDTQRSDINGIVDKRRAISTLLREYRSGDTVNEDTIISLARQYGALDGEISYYYAINFAKVGSTLTSDQKQSLVTLRGLTGYSCDGAYVYSEKITSPTIADTDFLFK